MPPIGLNVYFTAIHILKYLYLLVLVASADAVKGDDMPGLLLVGEDGAFVCVLLLDGYIIALSSARSLRSPHVMWSS